MTLRKQYKGVRHALSIYWRTYGGMAALLNSPFLHISLLLSLVCTPIWWDGDWWERSFAILPSVLGFSIAGFALLLGVGDERFRLLIGVNKKNGGASTLSNVSAGFLHFIATQVSALMIALIASARPLSFLIEYSFVDEAVNSSGSLIFLSKLFRFFGFLLLSYSLMSAIAVTLSIFRLGTIFSKYASIVKPKIHSEEALAASEE